MRRLLQLPVDRFGLVPQFRVLADEAPKRQADGAPPPKLEIEEAFLRR